MTNGPQPSERARLEAALRDPGAFVADERAAKAGYLLWSHLLERLDAAFAAGSTSVLAVKGAGLAATVYPRPWLREMSDVDLLVLRHHRGRALAALQRAGLEPSPTPADRRWSSGALGETPLRFVAGAVDRVVELHTGLDKLVRRPVAYPEIFCRSKPVPGWRALRVPCDEDHALLVVLHLATSGFAHPVAFLDLELLLRRSLDLDAMVRRARRWKLGTATFVALSALRALGSRSVSPSLVRRFEPRALRRHGLSRYYEPEGYPIARSPRELGWPWVVAQTPLRDDLGRWVLGVGVYAAIRAAEQARARLIR